MRYYDVVIHTNEGYFGNEDVFAQEPPLTASVQLSKDISIEVLEDDLANEIMNVCEPHWLNQFRPERLHSQMYTFMRLIDPVTRPIFLWDEDHRLLGTVALSRLVHPTRIGFSYAARIGIDQGKLIAAVPVEMRGIPADAFISPNNHRDWLTQSDSAMLAGIAPKVADKLPRRVHKALWFHEHAARNYYSDVRWPIVCIGLESLIHTDKWGSTKQFSCRVAGLAQEAGVNLSQADCAEAYELRCDLVHSGTFLVTAPSVSLPTRQIELYDRLEEVLRKTILRAISDGGFGAIFEDDIKIRSRWPA